MITLHFHLQPQYKYELFHINFTSLHCTGRYELNKLTSLPMCAFIAQLVEHRTGIAEVMGSNPVEALIFFRLLLSSCLNWKTYCDDHSSLSSTTAVQIWIISYKLHIENCMGKSPIVKTKLCVLITISFKIKFSFFQCVVKLSLVPIIKPFWHRLVKLFETV